MLGFKKFNRRWYHIRNIEAIWIVLIFLAMLALWVLVGTNKSGPMT